MIDKVTRSIGVVAVTVAAGFGAFAGLRATPPETMTWSQLLARPLPAADQRIAYGTDPLQFADLWLPKSKGPHPTVLMVHGGCWQSDIADASIMNYIADALRTRGIAVWNIEYRGIDRPGGGYPGTFLDVARAADALRSAAPRHHLRLERLVVVGHSAGGHLGLWLATRNRIPATSPLHASDPLPITTAISIGGLADLEAAQRQPGDTCGSDTVHQLTGTASRQRPDVYADTSPAALMPFGARQILVNTTLDPIAPPAFAQAYAALAHRKGVSVRTLTVADEGHAELIAPGTQSWAVVLAEIESALKPTS